MNIVIIGAGNVGYLLAQILSKQHSVTVVERDKKRFDYVVNSLNVGGINANGASPRILNQLLNEKTDLLMAVTESDEANIFACMTAKRLNPNVTTLARMRDRDYTFEDQLENYLSVDCIISPEYIVASKMKEIAMMDNAIDFEDIEAVGLSLAKFRIGPDNRHGIQGIALKHLPLPKKCKIIMIHRMSQKGMESIVPTDDDYFIVGDEAVVIGDRESLREFDKFLSPHKKHRDILMIGGSILAEYLLEMLSEEKVSVRLIEKDENRCQELSKMFDDAIIINDNGTDPLVLRSQDAKNTDVLVCTTNNEDGNLLSCLVGKHLGVSKTVTVYTKGDYRDIFRMAGIDAAIGYYGVVANEAIHQTVPEYEVLMTMESTTEEFIGLTVGPRCRIKDKMLIEANLPDRTNIALIITGTDIIIPGPEAVIKEGDTLLVYADKMDIHALEKLFGTTIPITP